MDDDRLKPIEDGLICPEVGSWTEEKHRRVSMYSTLFSTAMKDKWDALVYVELFAGAGFGRIRGTSKLIVGSPLLALTLKNPFDKYIFCEEDPEKLAALKNRAQRIAPSANVAFVSGDCNERTTEILAAIPVASSAHKVLSLCFADPYDISLRLETLRKLSSRYMDFLVLLALWSDANRAYRRYVMEDAIKVDEFLGSKSWRDRWKATERQGVHFPKFLAQEFSASMESLDYLPTPIHQMKLVRSDDKNLPLYYIAPFSRNALAHKFWDETLKYGTDQTSFSW